MKARKRFGQHFLERPWADKIVTLVAPGPHDHLIEIGPGRGALTVPLAETGVPLRAIEIDRDLAADLAGRLPANVALITGDFLSIDNAGLFDAAWPPARPGLAAPLDAKAKDGDQSPATPAQADAAAGSPGTTATEPSAPEATASEPPAPAADPSTRTRDASAPAAETGSQPASTIRIVGNLPYNLSSPIIVRLLALARETGRVRDATIMLQREVADRVTAQPGGGEWGPLGVLVALHAETDVLLQLPPGAFRPPPKVRSSIVRLRFRPFPVDVGDFVRFDTMVRTLFQLRRKTLNNALKPLLPPESRPAAEILSGVGIDPIRRPETLSLVELATLARALAASSH